ncbi:MAG: hypothetical protein IJK60_04540 [Clostridia bacterium]|nr:hypothetical protein [Clostridia bacterium]
MFEKELLSWQFQFAAAIAPLFRLASFEAGLEVFMIYTGFACDFTFNQIKRKGADR